MSLFAQAKKYAISLCGLFWILIQFSFFLPKGWPAPFLVYELRGDCGVIEVTQRGRRADLLGACADRFERFSRYEVVPQLRQNGISLIEKVILRGHDPEQTKALIELQKNFRVKAVYYPPDRAERMRKTFQIIAPGVQVRRLEANMGS